MKRNYLDFEKNLGYSFKNKELLKNSLIHRSFGNEHRRYKKISNERLELLGDAVLDLVVTEYLYKSYANSTEGDLAKVKSMVVSEPVLAGISKKLEVGKYLLRMSKGEELTGGRERVSLIADAVEALIAAIYLDKGLEFTKDYIIGRFEDIIKKAINNDIILDYKTRLQEYLQKNGEVSIVYELIKFEGPPHRRKFYTKLIIDSKELTYGEGYSKKESEQNAAKAALEILEGENE